MAFRAVIGALRVDLSLDTAQFEKAASRAQGIMRRVQSSLAGAAKAAAAAVATASVAMATAVRGTLKEADRLTKLAQSIGVPVDELSRLKWAADLSGVSLQSLSQGVGRLSANMFDMAKGVGETAARAFDQLNIEVKNADGTMKSSQQVLLEVADRFAGMEDGAVKTAAAMAIFGRSGRDMIPMLNQGSAGIRTMMAEADQLGIVIDEKTGKAAERFNDSLATIAQVIKGVVVQVTSNLAPQLAELAERFRDSAKEGGGLQAVVTGLTQFMRALMIAVEGVVLFFRRFAAELSAVAQAVKLASEGAFSQALARIRDETAKTDESFAAFAETARRTWRGVASAAANHADRITYPVEHATQGIHVMSEKAEKASERAAAAAARTMKRFEAEGRRVFEATRTPAERLAMEIERLNLLLEKGVISFDTYERAVKSAQDDFSSLGSTMEGVGRTMESSFGSAFDRLVDGTFNARDALSGLARDLSRMATNQFVRMAFSGFGDGGGDGGGLFAGWKLPGFASGGSFKVGGSGGIDSQLVAFRASPDERVTVTRPDQAMGGGDVTVHIHNNAGASVAANSSRGADGGLRLDVVIDEQAANLVNKPGSRLRRSLETNFGLSGQLRRR